MDIGSLLLGLALLLLVAFIVAQPLLERQGIQEKELSQADRLSAERENLLTALRDLDFDQATGKITDEDFIPQRAQLVARGVEVLKQLDALGVNSAARSANGGHGDAEAGIEQAIAAHRRSASDARKPQAARSPDDLIEAEIAARRRPLSEEGHTPSAAAVTCPHCGAAAAPGDRFCPKCGRALTLTCPECGQPAQAGDKFCGKCGSQLPQTEAL